MHTQITGAIGVGGSDGIGDGVPGSSRNAERADPWPQMEKQVVSMLQELTIQMQRYRDSDGSTVTSENELLEAIDSCSEAVEDMRFALDTAFDHPESFDITSEELQNRAEHMREWERDVSRAQRLGGQVRASQRARLQDSPQPQSKLAGVQDEDAAVGMGSSDGNHLNHSNNDILQQEHDTQRDIMLVDDQTLDRLSGGIQRVRETAVNIRDEMTVQERILDDIDQGMTRVQVRLDGVVRKVSRLLDRTSDKGKMICIAVLMLILFVLAVFIIR